MASPLRPAGYENPWLFIVAGYRLVVSVSGNGARRRGDDGRRGDSGGR
ncbi:MAG: hypothetical protein LBK76_09605 [Verrucomicrobiales bacterium]|nr:hypothetical protein [Verrucomicrobiales bacterium]